MNVCLNRLLSVSASTKSIKFKYEVAILIFNLLGFCTTIVLYHTFGFDTTIECNCKWSTWWSRRRDNGRNNESINRVVTVTHTTQLSPMQNRNVGLVKGSTGSLDMVLDICKTETLALKSCFLPYLWVYVQGWWCMFVVLWCLVLNCGWSISLGGGYSLEWL